MGSFIHVHNVVAKKSLKISKR